VKKSKPAKGKREYCFVVNATISMHCEVEAESLEEAVEKAQQAGVLSLCHQCAQGEKGQWNTSGELDCGDDPSEWELVDLHIGDDHSMGEKLFPSAQNLWSPP
jgi:hypothetical protein